MKLLQKLLLLTTIFITSTTYTCNWQNAKKMLHYSIAFGVIYAQECRALYNGLHAQEYLEKSPDADEQITKHLQKYLPTPVGIKVDDTSTSPLWAQFGHIFINKQIHTEFVSTILPAAHNRDPRAKELLGHIAAIGQHEYGHIMQNHATKQRIAGCTAPVITEALFYLAGKLFGTHVSRNISLGVTKLLVSSAFIKAYSRHSERQADAYVQDTPEMLHAFKNWLAAEVALKPVIELPFEDKGNDPIYRFFRTHPRWYTAYTHITQLASTHPTDEERIQAIDKRLKKLTV